MAKKILLVDDERDWVQVLMLRLKSFGYDIDVALDGMQAMMRLNKNTPDVVLLDIMMPAGGGLNVLKNLRENMKMFHIPVIVISAAGDSKVKESAEKLGIAAYFSKPLDIDILKAKLEEILGEGPEPNSGTI